MMIALGILIALGLAVVLMIMREPKAPVINVDVDPVEPDYGAYEKLVEKQRQLLEGYEARIAEINRLEAERLLHKTKEKVKEKLPEVPPKGEGTGEKVEDPPKKVEKAPIVENPVPYVDKSLEFMTYEELGAELVKNYFNFGLREPSGEADRNRRIRLLMNQMLKVLEYKKADTLTTTEDDAYQKPEKKGPIPVM